MPPDTDFFSDIIADLLESQIYRHFCKIISGINSLISHHDLILLCDGIEEAFEGKIVYDNMSHYIKPNTSFQLGCPLLTRGFLIIDENNIVIEKCAFLNKKYYKTSKGKFEYDKFPIDSYIKGVIKQYFNIKNMGENYIPKTYYKNQSLREYLRKNISRRVTNDFVFRLSDTLEDIYTTEDLKDMVIDISYTGKNILCFKLISLNTTYLTLYISENTSILLTNPFKGINDTNIEKEILNQILL